MKQSMNTWWVPTESYVRVCVCVYRMDPHVELCVHVCAPWSHMRTRVYVCEAHVQSCMHVRAR